MTNFRKKLIEVALPLEAINKASAREKSIRHGHPSTLHLWWARRPLAAARAVIFAQMVDDPSGYVEDLLNDSFKRSEAEAELKIKLAEWAQRKTEAEKRQALGDFNEPEPAPPPTLEEVAAEIERQRIFRLIEELVLWENPPTKRYCRGRGQRLGVAGRGIAWGRRLPACKTKTLSNGWMRARCPRSQGFTIPLPGVGRYRWKRNDWGWKAMPAT